MERDGERAGKQERNEEKNGEEERDEEQERRIETMRERELALFKKGTQSRRQFGKCFSHRMVSSILREKSLLFLVEQREYVNMASDTTGRLDSDG